MPGPVSLTFRSWPRACDACGVGWHGGPVCWMCFTPSLRTDEQAAWRGLSWEERAVLLRAAENEGT